MSGPSTRSMAPQFIAQECERARALVMEAARIMRGAQQVQREANVSGLPQTIDRIINDLLHERTLLTSCAFVYRSLMLKPAKAPALTAADQG